MSLLLLGRLDLCTKGGGSRAGEAGVLAAQCSVASVPQQLGCLSHLCCLHFSHKHCHSLGREPEEWARMWLPPSFSFLTAWWGGGRALGLICHPHYTGWGHGLSCHGRAIGCGHHPCCFPSPASPMLTHHLRGAGVWVSQASCALSRGVSVELWGTQKASHSS